MKTCLVTGGAGFIGANLVRKLLTSGHRIHVATEKATPLWRLTNILNQITVHEVDLTNFEKINELITTIKPELIFHLASFGGNHNQNDQETIYYTNFDGTVNLLNVCKEVGFDCFINTGSSSEYGMKSTAMKEDLVLEPITDYGISKAAATQFCFKEAVFNKLPVYTVRPFAVYGDYEMPGRLIPSVLVNALQNKPVTLSSPHFVRDFIYIDDMVDIYIAITKQMPQNHFIFNAGTGVQSSIQDVINTLSPMCDKPIITQWNMREPRPWEPKCWKADHTLAQQVLNWHPHYNLAKGLKKSLTWFKNHLELYVEGTTYHAHTTQQQQAL